MGVKQPTPQILGLGELKEKFTALGENMKTRGARIMVSSAGGVIKAQAKSNVRNGGFVKSGAFLKNIALKRERDAPEGQVEYNLGVRHGKDLSKKAKANHRLAVNRKGRIVKKYDDDPWYWKFIEFGTKHIKAAHPLQNALEQKKDEAIKAMEDRLDKELKKVAK